MTHMQHNNLAGRSAIVATIAQCYDANGKRIEDPAEAVATLVKGLADGVRSKQMA